MKRYCFLLPCLLLFIALSPRLDRAYADDRKDSESRSPYQKLVRVNVGQLETLRSLELQSLISGKREVAARKLDQPVVLTVRDVPFLGVFRVVLNKVRHYNMTEFNVVRADGTTERVPLRNPAIYLRGYARKQGANLGPISAQLLGSTLKLRLLFLNLRQQFIGIEIDLAKAKEGKYVLARYYRDARTATKLKSMLGDASAHVRELSSASARTRQFPRVSAGGVNPLASKTIEVVAEGDAEFYAAVSNSTETMTNEITAIMDATEVIYDRDLDIDFNIVDTTLYTDSNTQPYTTTDGNDLLDQVEANGACGADGDLNLLFTGKDIDEDNSGAVGRRGLANLGAMCVSRQQSAGIFEYIGSTDNAQILFVAHEVGHTMNALHPHDLLVSGTSTPSSSPDCVTQACCDGGGVAAGARCPEEADEGLIMDGSATFPIASSALAFSTDSQSEINTFLTASGSCLTETNTGSGCGNTTPTPSLSGSVSASLDKKTGTTSIALSFTQSLDGCSGTLYASHKKNFSTLDRSSKTWSKNVRQLVFTPSGTTNEISSKVKRKAKGALRLFIELVCNGSTITSSEISIRGYGGIKSKSSKKLPMKKYIKKFIKKARRRSG